jgi:hypothetical protein
MLLLLMAGFCALDFGSFLAGAQTTNAPSKLDFSNFRIITDRNIFNSRRSARYVPTERTRRSTPRSDSFALVGTMNYNGKGPLAFFEGSSPDYRKVLKPDETIAGFKLAEIEPSYVKLSSPTNQVQLRIGMQLVHSQDGGWQVSERPETTTPATSSSNSSRFSRPSAATSVALGPASTNSVGTEVPPADLENGPPVGLAEPSEPASGAEPVPPPGGENDVLERLRRRAAAERGE